jgi:predicted nucleotidyltransferase
MAGSIHDQAIDYLLNKIQGMAVTSILTYGSYARGDHKSDSDIDLLVVLDSKRYSSKDLNTLMEVCKVCRKKFHVSFQMDILLDSEIELWNKGILLEGHSFIDLSFYKKDGKVLFGEDIRERFKLPENLAEKAYVLLDIIEAEFKRWFLEGDGERHLVPHWMTGWLLVTFLNTQRIADAPSFQETCRQIEQIQIIAMNPQFEKYKREEELTADEFIRLYRIIKRYSQGELVNLDT